jgi:hypothetical protein
MTVVSGRIDVSDGVMAPTFSAISAIRVPGRDQQGALRPAPAAL